MDFSTYLQNKRILGALLVGGGLVVGTLVITNFGTNNTTPPQNTQVVAAPPARTFIPVTDSTGDGIEDWRDEFVSREPVILPTPEADPIPEFTPDTVTEVMSIEFMQNILEARAGFGSRPSEQIIEETIERFSSVAEDELYTIRDITTIAPSDESIRLYANTMANSLMARNVPDYEDELTIIDRALKMESEAELQKLLPLENMYRQLRDDALNTPVPSNLTKEHLDLINVYNALYAGLRDIRLVFTDPVVAMMRVKRFNDDTLGMVNALENVYTALEPYARVFGPDDPAVILVTFAPSFNR
jgi:hypothetical protein